MRYEIGETVLTDEGLKGVIIALDTSGDTFNPWYLIRYENGKEEFIIEQCLEGKIRAPQRLNPATAYIAKNLAKVSYGPYAPTMPW